MKKSNFEGKIYVDMDDVIVDFVHHTHNTLGTPHHERSNKLSGLPYRDEIKKVHNWWVDVPARPDADELMKYLKRYNPHILSAFAKWDERSKTDKLIWLQKHFPWLHKDRIHIVHRHEKREYAVLNGVPNILIDDYSKNILEWKEAGGIGIQHVGTRSTIMKLKELNI